MIWLTWRQHRGAALGLVAVLVVVGALALVTGLPMRATFERDVAECMGYASLSCAQIVEAFGNKHGGVPLAVAGQLHLLPLLVGAIVGAPMIAREHEQGTWQLAWTQAVPRTRWMVAKLALVLAAVGLMAVALSAVLTWWLEPLVSTAFRAERFNYTPLVLTGYFVLAVGIGILAGAVVKRAIPAMVATLAVFLPIRLLIEFWLRPRYLTPVTAVDVAPGDPTVTDAINSGHDWVLDRFLVDGSGSRLTDAEEYDLLGGGVVDDAMLAQHDLRETVVYHPAERFWDFQLIETAIIGGLAVIVVLLAVWRVRRW